ncbi:hypothetical protein AAG570_011319 [Ranatra chinensis]|uniref:Uncharacterized protein n=1 Tax=Ranatra chinensis TaxID=642074 RepID=A0ABD0YKK6_9HEMI
MALPDGEYRRNGHYSTRRSRDRHVLSRRGGFKGWVEEDREDARGLGDKWPQSFTCLLDHLSSPLLGTRPKTPPDGRGQKKTDEENGTEEVGPQDSKDFPAGRPGIFSTPV